VSARETDPGLCRDCTSGRRVESARASVFWLCARAAVDPAFPRYPRLPVHRCEGYRAAAPETVAKGEGQ
jgi:hypothetical protein